jgi:hypothetical protein
MLVIGRRQGGDEAVSLRGIFVRHLALLYQQITQPYRYAYPPDCARPQKRFSAGLTLMP